MPVFDFSVLPQRTQDLAASSNALARARVEQSRQDEAYNALRDIYGPTAGNPALASDLQQIGIDRQAADIAQQDAQIRQQAAARAQQEAATAAQLQEQEQNRQGLLEAATFVETQMARGVDPGKAFDMVVGRLNITPEEAAEIRQMIVADPDMVGGLIESLGSATGAAPSAALVGEQNDAVLNAMRYAATAAGRGDDPVAALNSVIGRIGLPASEVQRLAQIAGNPAALAAYVESFGDQDQMLARVEAINDLPPEEREAALQVLRVTTPGAAQDIAAARAVGTGQGEAILGLPEMAGNIAQVETRIADVLDPERSDQFSALFGLPTWDGFREGGLGYLGEVPGSPTADAAADLEQIMGDISAAAYASLRGGGHITEAERTSVERAYANLNRKQSWHSFQQNLREFQLTLNRIYERQQRTAQGSFDDFLLADVTQDNWARGLFRVDTGDTTDGGDGPAQIANDDEYNALPAGAHFIGPDGIERIKP